MRLPWLSSQCPPKPEISLIIFCDRRIPNCWCSIVILKPMFTPWFRRARRFRKWFLKTNKKLQNRVRSKTMQLFHIRYRNSQGSLMRILNAVSRRGLDLTSVHAEADAQDYGVTMLLAVNHKQIGQLYREWHGIVDV